MTNSDKKRNLVLSILPSNWTNAEKLLKELEKTGWKWKGASARGKRIITKRGKNSSFAYYLRHLEGVETKRRVNKPNLFRKRL